MALQFHPLPAEIFDEKARPYIKRLNFELRDLFGLEGTIRQPISTRSSDLTIARRSELQVAVSRITPSIASVVSGVSTVVGTPALTLGTANTIGSTTSALSVNSAIAMFGTQAPLGLSLSAAVGTSAYAARADHVHAGFDATAVGAIGSTAATGSIDFSARRDHQHIYPIALRSTANASTLTLTDDATDQTLTGSLGVLNIVPGTGIDIDFPNSSAASLNIKPNTTTASVLLISVQGRPVAGTRTLIAPNWFGAAASDVFSSQTFRCWDAQFSSYVTGQITSCVFVGHDISAMALLPSVGSGAGNKAYGFRANNLTINNANATWDEIATAYFPGPDRVISAVTATLTAGAIVEPAVVGGTKQVGLLVRQRAAEQTATDRFGIDVEAQNSGTNRWAFRGGNKIENTVSDFICSTTAKGLVTTDAQATPRYWRMYNDAVEGTTGSATLSVDASGTLTVTRAAGSTGSIRIQIGDIGTAAPTT